MANTIGKNLHLCFTKIKRPEEHRSNSAQRSSSDDHSQPVLRKNYNSLRDCHFDSASKSLPRSLSSMSASSFSSSTSSDGDGPEFATVFASHRFFFSSPGRSNSIIESTPGSTATSSKSSDSLVMNINDNAVAPHPEGSTTALTNRSSLVDSRESQFPESQKSYQTVRDNSTIAVPTYSRDPYLDFRRSMQEMAEARDLLDVKANWDCLHELLLCYLALNSKTAHKFIVRAFADLLLSLLSSEPENAGNRESGSEMWRLRM